ncbi:MAG: lipocalin family protein [Bacteroidales bacterium]|jgi:hypothetical protein|nr:lipocalin family protein [Bacteroidales bacterium]
MNRKLLYIFVSAVLFGSILVSSCKEEEDHDLIIGKWRVAEVVADTTATPCALQSHIEFSDYVFEAAKRQMLDVVVGVKSATPIKDSTGQIIGYDYVCRDPAYTSYNYTVSNDTLTLNNNTTHAIKKYIIQKITNDSMIWKSLTQEVYYKYLRWQ